MLTTWSQLLVVLWILCFVSATRGLPRTIRLGGLFDDYEVEQELVFQIAVDWVNDETALLPKSSLVAHIERHDPDDSFVATKKVCQLLKKGVAGVFGPQSPLAAAHVQSISDALEVPHIETRWDYKVQRDDLSVNFYPRPAHLNRAYMDLVKKWGWTHFFVVYEENEGIIRLQDFLKESTMNNWDIQVYQFHPQQPYRNLFRQIRASMTKWPKRDICILLDVNKKHLKTILKQAQQVEMMTGRNKYVVTSLDLHTINLEDFQYSRANITGFKIINTESEDYEELLNETNYRMYRQTKRSINTLSACSPQVELYEIWHYHSLKERNRQWLQPKARYEAYVSYVNFPVRLAFAMTINKAQGQSLQVCGLDLENPCFSHGQLHVASSSVGKPADLFVYAPDGKTKIIVYPQALTTL